MKKINNYEELLAEEIRLKEKLEDSNLRVKEEFNQVIQPKYLVNELIVKPVQEEFNFQYNGNLIAHSYDYLFERLYRLFEPKEGKEDKDWKMGIRTNLDNVYHDNRENIISITKLLIDRQLNKFFRKKGL